MPEETYPSRLQTREEVERAYGISKRFLELAAARGGGPPMVRIGRSVRYRPADVEAWIESQIATSNRRAG